MADTKKKIVHVVGTGTIGEPLIGLLTDFRDQEGEFRDVFVDALAQFPFAEVCIT